MTDEQNQNHEEPVIRDKRRIDPETGEVRHPDQADGAPAEGAPEAAGAEAEPAAKPVPRHPTSPRTSTSSRSKTS